MERADDSVDFPDVDLKARILIIDRTRPTTQNCIDANSAVHVSANLQKCLQTLSTTGIQIDVIQSQIFLNSTMLRRFDQDVIARETCQTRVQDDTYEAQNGVTKIYCDKSLSDSIKRQMTRRSYFLLVMFISRQDAIDEETVKYVRQTLSSFKIITLIYIEGCDTFENSDVFMDTINNIKNILLPNGSRVTYCPEQSLFIYNRTNQADSPIYGSVDTTTFAALAYCLAIGLPVEKIPSILVCKTICETSLAYKPLNVVKFVKKCGRVIYDKRCLTQLRELAIRSQQKVGLTTGCYDMCHAGHAAFLEDAKQQADILVVALNSDESVKIRKGNNRPIFNLKQRLTVLLSLKSVDFIVVFDEKRPSWVVETLDPDVFIKGYEYDEAALRKSYPNLRDIHITQKRYDIHTSSIIKAKL